MDLDDLDWFGCGVTATPQSGRPGLVTYLGRDGLFAIDNSSPHKVVEIETFLIRLPTTSPSGELTLSVWAEPVHRMFRFWQIIRITFVHFWSDNGWETKQILYNPDTTTDELEDFIQKLEW